MKRVLRFAGLSAIIVCAAARPANGQKVFSLTGPVSPVQPGQIAEFDLTVANSGTASVSGSDVYFSVPQNTTYGSDPAGDSEYVFVSSLSAGQAQVTQLYFTVASGNVAPPDGTPITLDITSGGGAQLAAASVVVNSSPVLDLQLSTDQSTVAPGAEFTYTLTYSTLGQDTVNGCTLTLPIPAGATFVSADNGADSTGGLVTWSLGSIQPGVNGQVHVTFAAGSGDTSGQLIVLAATLADSTQDSAQAGDTRIVEASPSLTYTLTAPADPVMPGQVVEFDLTVSNLGSASVSGHSLYFTVPQYTLDGSLGPGKSDYVELSTLAPGQSEIFQIYLTVDSGNQAPPDGAGITLDMVDDDGATVSRTVVANSAPVLDLQLSTDQANPAPGGNFTYTLAYSTLDDTSVSGGVLTLTVPAGATFVSADNGGTDTNGVVSWPIGTISPGVNGQVHVTFSAAGGDQTGDLLLLEAMIEDGAGDIARASDTRIVASSPSLSYALTAPADPVKPGQVAEFDLTVTNPGSTTVQGHSLYFTVPQYTTGPSSQKAGANVYEEVNTLAAGQSEIFQIYLNIDGGNLAPPDGTPVTLDAVDDRYASISRTIVADSSPVLNLQLSTDQSNPAPKGDFTYTLAYSTLGAASVSNGTLSLPVPAGAAFVSADGGGVLGSGVVTWPVGTISPGVNGQVHVTFSANSGDESGQLLLLEATLVDAAGDVVRASDSRIVQAAPALVYTLTTPTDPVKPGQVAEFDLTVSNIGTSSVGGHSLYFTVPQYTVGSNGDKAGANTYEEVNTLASGQSETFQIYLDIDTGNAAPPDGTGITLNIVDDDYASLSRTVVAHTTPALDLQLSTDQANPAPKSDFTYTLDYSTLGRASVSGTLALPVPTGSTFVSADSGGTLSNGVITWPLGTIAPGVNGQVHAAFAVKSTDENGQLLLLEAVLQDSVGDIARASDARIVQAAPSLVYTLTAPADPVEPGQVVEFDLTVSNLGSSTVSGHSVYFTVPQYTVDSNGNKAGVNTYEGVDQLAPGASQIIPILLDVDTGSAAPPDGTAITMDIVDDNFASVSRTVVAQVNPPLNLQLSCGVSNPIPGGDYTYSLSWFTPDDTNLTGGELSVPVPTGAAFVSADGGGALANGVVTWPIGAINSGTNGQVHLTLKASANAETGALDLLEAELSDSSGDIARASDARVVNSMPPIAYTISSPDSAVVPAQQIEFVLTATNVGTANYEPDVYFNVPPYTTYNGYAAGSEQYVYGFDTLASGTAISVTIPLTVTSGTAAPPPGATITLDAIDLYGSSVSDSITVQSASPPAPSITSALSASGTQGQPFDYQITASADPSSFGETGLPAQLDLALNPGTGLISGTPAESGTFTATLSAVNSSGTGTAGLTIVIIPATYTVTPGAGANGSINPNTLQSVTSGGSIGFTATPSTGYVVDQWLVNGNVAQTGGDTYALNDITANDTVTVTFMLAPVTYTVTPSAGADGGISPNTAQSIASGGTASFIATPSSGYVVNQWLVNGNVAQTGGTSYSLADVTASASVQVTFMPAPVTYNITPSAGANGSVNPGTAQTVDSGGAIGFTATPANGYEVNQWLVNGATAQTGGDSYTLNNVTADATVQVTFMLIPIPGEYFTISSAVVSDTGGQAVVTVSRNFTGSASIQYQTVNGTALANLDYTAASGAINFTGNQTQQTIAVPILADVGAAATTDFSIQLFNPGGGGAIGTPGVGTVDILNTLTGDLTLSQTGFVMPLPAPASNASITVTLTPAAADGQWRLFGELDWRNSGDTATGLVSGNYEIEFKPADGYQQPALQTVPLLAGGQAGITGTYTADGSPATGSLQVDLAPQALGGWRFQGESAWRSGGATVTGVNTGDYILEFEPVAGLATPRNVEAIVYANQLATLNITYFVADSTLGLPPALVSSTIAQTQSPYVFTGQIQTDEGVGSGFVPLDRIVVTAAHVLFDDVTLSYVTGVQWFFQYQSGTFEAPAQIPRGSFVLEGYAAQRAVDDSPGVSSAASQQLDVAALYFYEPAARGGQSGYLGSNSTDNPWLTGGQDKFLAGYPVDGVTPTGHLYATPIIEDPFQNVTGSLFKTTAIASYPGNSGGPLFVRFNGGDFFPAAVYLGGTGETVVHAIDGPVTELMTEAEAAGNGGENNSGGGIIQVSEGVSGNVASAAGSVNVSFQPAGAIADGAYWELANDTTKRLGNEPAALPPGNYTVNFFTSGKGYSAPAAMQVAVGFNSVVTVTGTYAANAPTITSATTAVAIQGQPFSYQISVTPDAATYSTSAPLPSGLVLDAASGVISGTAGGPAGVFDIPLQATNGQGPSMPVTLALTVAQPSELTVTVSGKGAVTKAFEKPTTQAAGSMLTIKATPKSGSVFAYWSDASTGDILSTQATYPFTMPGTQNAPGALYLQANFVTNPYQTAKGSYLALFQGGTYDQSGFAQVTVKDNGAFTMLLNLGGGVATVKNTFDNQGSAGGAFYLPDGTTYNAALSLTAGGILSGTLTNTADGSQLPLNAQLAAPHAADPLAGAYTILFPAPAGAGLPGGNGYGALTVSRTGAVKFTGQLGDGLPVKLSGALDSNGVWPFAYFKPASKTAGSELLVGNIAFPPAASGTAGVLTWYRSASLSDPVYGGGFATEIPALASAYAEPAVSYNSATVTFSGADIMTPISRTVSIVNGKVTPAAGTPFKLALTARTGLFTGSFTDTGGVRRNFAGAILQSGATALGLFEAAGHAGAVLLQPNP